MLVCSSLRGRLISTILFGAASQDRGEVVSLEAETGFAASRTVLSRFNTPAVTAGSLSNDQA